VIAAELGCRSAPGRGALSRSKQLPAALIAESFGPNVRYSGAGLGYQLASVIAGGPAPLIAAAILGATSSSTFISVYLVGCAVISMVALLLMPRRPVEIAPSKFDEAADRLTAEERAGARA
jgi:hypothetical protein